MSDFSPTKFTFSGRIGYIVKTPGNLLGLGHTAGVDPWSDTHLHFHKHSEEYYLLLQGRMFLLVSNYLIDLLPNEILMARPIISHAVVAIDTQKIEHIGFRAPFRDDKVKLEKVPVNLPTLSFLKDREIRDKGFVRIPLNDVQFQNWWTFGFGSAIIKSQNMIWGLMDINDVSRYKTLNYEKEYHSHTESWEYYGVIFGSDILEINGTEVRVHAGEIVEVPPKVCHKRIGLEYPFRGFTIRVPIKENDKSLCNGFTD